MKILRQTFMGRLAVVAVVLGLGPAPLIAQVVRPAPGERVRVQVGRGSVPQVFELKEVIADTLVLEGLNEGTPTTQMLVGSISRLQVSDGYRSAGSRALRGAGWGFGSGFVVGGIIGLASGNDRGGFLAFSAEEKAVFAGSLLGVAGLVAGTVIGLASNAEQWKSIPLEQITIAPTSNGALVIGIRGAL